MMLLVDWLILDLGLIPKDNEITLRSDTSVMRPRGPANDASRTSVFAPLTYEMIIEMIHELSRTAS